MASHFLRRLAVLLMGVVLGGGLLVTPANASTSAPDAAATQPQYCSDPTFGGTLLCPYGRLFHTFSNGTKQIFVIGTNHQIYTKWRRKDGTFSSWVNMGGEIRHTYSASDWHLEVCAGMSTISIYVIGTNSKLYNNTRVNNAWTGWELGTTICFDNPTVVIPEGFDDRR